jgi:hypothetical protein
LIHPGCPLSFSSPRCATFHPATHRATADPAPSRRESGPLSRRAQQHECRADYRCAETPVNGREDELRRLKQVKNSRPRSRPHRRGAGSMVTRGLRPLPSIAILPFTGSTIQIWFWPS